MTAPASIAAKARTVASYWPQGPTGDRARPPVDLPAFYALANSIGAC